MENAIRGSLSTLGILLTFGRFILTAIYLRSTTSLTTARTPMGTVDFPLIDMANHCHTELAYATLTAEQTQKLIEKCRKENATVTSAISSAILCAASTMVPANSKSEDTVLNFAIGADTRRRCAPSVANHDLSYHAAGMMLFVVPTKDVPTTPVKMLFVVPTKDVPTTPVKMWQLATTLGRHIQTSVDAGQVLSTGLIMGKVYDKTLGASDVSDLPTCGISSWGVLPFHEQYGKWKLAAMTPFANMIRGPWPFALLQTVNGVLTITITGADPVVPRTVTESLRDGTLHNLKQMIDVQ